jgi:integrase
MATGSFRKRGCKCSPERKRCTCGAKWYYRYDIIDPATGKRKQKEVGGFRTKEEAEEAAKRIQYELQTGTYVEPTKTTVESFLLEYVDQTLKNEVAPNTYEQRKAYIKNHIGPKIGKIALTSLTPMHVQKFYNDLIEHFGPGHVQNIANLLSKALNQAVRWGIISRNPATLVKKPSTSRKNTKIKVWMVEEQKKFLKCVEEDNQFYYTLFLLALTSGMREGELLALFRECVDLKNNSITVKRTIVRMSHGVYIGDKPKTESSIRTIQIPMKTTQALRRWLMKCPPNSMNLVFPSPKTNGILHPNSLHKAFDKYIKMAGVPRITFHGLRHTFATTLLANNVNPKIVQEMLGHATIKTTMDTYSHVLPNMQRTAAEQLGAVLF